MNRLDEIARGELAMAIGYLAEGDRMKALGAVESALNTIEDSIARERQKATAHAVANVVREFTAAIR